MNKTKFTEKVCQGFQTTKGNKRAFDIQLFSRNSYIAPQLLTILVIPLSNAWLRGSF